MKTIARLGLLVLALGGTGAHADNNRFCGGEVHQTGVPADLANVVGDQTIEHAVDAPASVVVCSAGYESAKCGDFDSAFKIYDKCIAAGYVGAMIWKALLLEDGTGIKPDLTKAAELMHRAANSGDPAYGPIGKMHYATMLHQGKGVPRDEAAARQWFEAAAADGSEEARDFLRTGYHTGERDQKTMGAGTPPPGALVRGLTGDNASIFSTAESANATPISITADATVNRKKQPNLKTGQVAKLVADDTKTPPPESTEPPSDLVGQKLTAVTPSVTVAPPAESLWMALLLMLTVAAGILRQRAKTTSHRASDRKNP